MRVPTMLLALGDPDPPPRWAARKGAAPTSLRQTGAKRATLRVMTAPKIRVANGRIQIDEPTDLPNGTELYLVPAEQLEGGDDLDDEERAALHRELEASMGEAEAMNGGDDLDDAERAELHESIREGIEDMDAGRTVDAKTAITELRSRL